MQMTSFCGTNFECWLLLLRMSKFSFAGPDAQPRSAHVPVYFVSSHNTCIICIELGGSGSGAYKEQKLREVLFFCCMVPLSFRYCLVEKFVSNVVQNMISVNECDSPMTTSGQFDVENKYDLVMIKDSEIQKATETTHGTVPAVVTPAPASPVEETSRPHDLELDADVQEKSNHVKITVSRIKRA